MPGRLAALIRPQPTPALRRRLGLALAAALALRVATASAAPATTATSRPASTTPAAPTPRSTSTIPAAPTPRPTSDAAPGSPTTPRAANPTTSPPTTSTATPTTSPPTTSTANPTTSPPTTTQPTTDLTPAQLADPPAAPDGAASFTTGPRASSRRASPPPAGEIPPEPPRDPNDAPFMQPPNNQPRPVKLRTSPDLRRGYSSVRRFALTIAPVFASFRLPFLGRCPTCRATDPAPRQHGVGVGGEFDVQIIRWLWLRAQGSYSVHPVGDVRVADDQMNVVVLAPAGTIRALGFGLGPVVALDLGRFIPLIEGGLGGLRVATPPGVRPGQMGQACDDSACDVGLRCGADNMCHQGLIADLYFGGAIDMLVRKHISLGVQFRYHALLSAPGKFPVYLIGGLRLGVRF